MASDEDYKQRDLERRERAEVDRAVMEDQSRRDVIEKAARGESSVKGGGGTSISWGLPGERTALAQFIVKLGWRSLVVGILLWVLHLAMPIMIGESLPGLVIGLGGFCLILVYLFQGVAFILTLAALLIIWNAGTTPEGFKLSAVPVYAYLAGFGMIAVGYILKKLLSKD